MIELRWLTRMVDRPKGIDDGFYQPPLPDKMETRVLQYRYRLQDGRWDLWRDVAEEVAQLFAAEDGEKK